LSSFLAEVAYTGPANKQWVIGSDLTSFRPRFREERSEGMSWGHPLRTPHNENNTERPI